MPVGLRRKSLYLLCTALRLLNDAGERRPKSPEVSNKEWLSPTFCGSKSWDPQEWRKLINSEGEKTGGIPIINAASSDKIGALSVHILHKQIFNHNHLDKTKKFNALNTALPQRSCLRLSLVWLPQFSRVVSPTGTGVVLSSRVVHRACVGLHT